MLLKHLCMVLKITQQTQAVAVNVEKIWNFTFRDMDLVSIQHDNILYERCLKPPVEILRGQKIEDILVFRTDLLYNPIYVVIEKCSRYKDEYIIWGRSADPRSPNTTVDDYLEYIEPEYIFWKVTA